ncbi:DJ-1/PfpI family protein [Shewanella mangrovi]|uniref:DJ-1/PfpI family protein n=1 Tax=Shewanella mangrovi TaxID=1515746 RepID=UPI00068D4ED3|nr:DJ-1/PfpI family protein [Shewanella mangrovi]
MHNPINIGIFLYPGMTMLDAYGPLQLLSFATGINCFTFAKTSAPVPCDAGINLLPNYAFADCPAIDILLVAGGGNPVQPMQDTATHDFLRQAATNAQYITSVCTGALILASAGLLDGYQTACHWAYKEAFIRFPRVDVLDQRVVIDRNHISGGGITAGLDFALTLIAKLQGDAAAQTLQLLLEYDPQPPFSSGSPKTAALELVAGVQAEVHKLAPELFD